MRVDDKSKIRRFFIDIYGVLLGAPLFLMLKILSLTCKVTITEKGLRKDKNYIYCFWHQNFILWFTSFISHPKGHSWMGHPAWYMKPIFVCLHLMGVKDIILTPPGRKGVEAALVLKKRLLEGASSVIAVDGPYGPIEVAKNGYLHLALESGVALIAVSFKVSKAYRLPFSWDKKWVPAPFSKIEVLMEEAVYVGNDNFERVKKSFPKRLAHKMGQSI